MDRRGFLEGLLGVTMAIAGLLVLGYILLSELDLTSAAAATTPVPPVPTSTEVDLWVAHARACAVAQAQVADAQLVSASTQWQAPSEEALLDGADNWSFAFYSAAGSSMLDVIVNTGEARVVNQTRIWKTPKVMDVGGWHKGPREALLVFLAYGGRAFLAEHSQAVVDLHLAENDDGVSVWTIVALDTSDRSMLAVLIDAETNQLLSSTF